MSQLNTKHESDGDISQIDIINNLPGLPQDIPGEDHIKGAQKRQIWLEKKDWEAWLDNLAIGDGTLIPQLPKHIKERKNQEFTEKEINEIMNSLQPWKKYKKKSKKVKVKKN